MSTLVLIALAGFGAQLVDGSLGMGYGVTSASLLLAMGLTPAVASASVNVAQLGTTLASGVSHARLGNVDWRIVRRLGLPGATGALAGATLLSSMSTQVARPVMAVLLLSLGVFIAVRFTVRPPGRDGGPGRWGRRRRFLGPVGVVGGFVNATGGGGWGPVATTTLLCTGQVAPRTVIGSVATSEFLVTLAASLGFVLGLGLSGMNWWIIGALMLGGVLAAPVAALLVGRMPPVLLGVAVGGVITLLNLGPVLSLAGLPWAVTVTAYAVVLGTWSLLLAAAVVRARRSPGALQVGDHPADGVQGARDVVVRR